MRVASRKAMWTTFGRVAPHAAWRTGSKGNRGRERKANKVRSGPENQGSLDEDVLVRRNSLISHKAETRGGVFASRADLEGGARTRRRGSEKQKKKRRRCDSSFRRSRKIDRMVPNRPRGDWIRSNAWTSARRTYVKEVFWEVGKGKAHGYRNLNWQIS